MLSLMLFTLWLGNPLVMQILAQETGSASDGSLVWLFNLGTAGVWLVCMMTGLLHTKPDYERLVEEGKAKDRAIEALVAQMTNRTLPALADVSQMVAGYSQGGDQSHSRERLEGLLARLERRLGDERST